jgi:hypothetical protein
MVKSAALILPASLLQFDEHLLWPAIQRLFCAAGALLRLRVSGV